MEGIPTVKYIRRFLIDRGLVELEQGHLPVRFLNLWEAVEAAWGAVHMNKGAFFYQMVAPEGDRTKREELPGHRGESGTQATTVAHPSHGGIAS